MIFASDETISRGTKDDQSRMIGRHDTQALDFGEQTLSNTGNQ